MVRRSTPAGRSKPRRALLAGLAAGVLAACGTSPGVQTESARQATTVPPPTPTTPRRPSTTAHPTTDARLDRARHDRARRPTRRPAARRRRPTGTRAARRRRRQAAPRLRRPGPGGARRPRAVVGRGVPRALRRAVRAADRAASTPRIPSAPTRSPAAAAPRRRPYEEINQYGAFYCQEGDFLVYDDGADGVLATLSTEFGPPILGVVLAHEYGHVVQARAGDLERGLPTITTEQQADCFAGAWVARAVRGEAPGVAFTDADVRTGLIAMITVRDPPGIDQLERRRPRLGVRPRRRVPGRVRRGAGRLHGAARRAAAAGPQRLQPDRGSEPGGRLDFGYDDGQIGGSWSRDLNVFWPATVSAQGAS